MNTEVIDWMIERMLGDLSNEALNKFLSVLKNDEQAVVAKVSDSVCTLSRVACVEFGKTIYVDNINTFGQKIVDRIKETFATELEAVS